VKILIFVFIMLMILLCVVDELLMNLFENYMLFIES